MFAEFGTPLVRSGREWQQEPCGGGLTLWLSIVLAIHMLLWRHNSGVPRLQALAHCMCSFGVMLLPTTLQRAQAIGREQLHNGQVLYGTRVQKLLDKVCKFVSGSFAPRGTWWFTRAFFLRTANVSLRDRMELRMASATGGSGSNSAQDLQPPPTETRTRHGGQIHLLTASRNRGVCGSHGRHHPAPPTHTGQFPCAHHCGCQIRIPESNIQAQKAFPHPRRKEKEKKNMKKTAVGKPFLAVCFYSGAR